MMNSDLCIANAITVANQSSQFMPLKLQELAMETFGNIVSQPTRADHMASISLEESKSISAAIISPMDLALNEAKNKLKSILGDNFKGFQFQNSESITVSANAIQHAPSTDRVR